MPYTPARFTQADIARALRAMEQRDGDWRLLVLPDGTLVIEKGEAHQPTPEKPLEARYLERM